MLLKTKLFKDTALYSIINIIDKIIPFLIMSIISRVLSKSEMGEYSLYQITVQILLPLITFSIAYSINVNFFKLGKKEYSIYQSTGIYLVLILFFLFITLGFIFSDFLSNIFGLAKKWLELTIVIVFLQFINQLRLNLWRAKREPISYGCFSIPLSLVKNILGLFIILYSKSGWEGIILGHFYGYLFFSVIAIFTFVKEKTLLLVFEKRYITDMLKIGIPISIHRISAWFSTSLNRIIINSILGAAATGSYGIGSTFGTIVTVLEDAVNKAYSPYLYEKLAKLSNENAKKIVKLIGIYYIGFIAIGLIISIIGYFSVGLIFGNSYLDTRSFIFPIVLSAVINGLYKLHVNIITFSKKTYIIARNTIICAIINIGLAIYFVKSYGLMGAAYSSVIIQLILYVLTVYYSNKQYKLPWSTLFVKKLRIN